MNIQLDKKKSRKENNERFKVGFKSKNNKWF